jgi:hypothetical protein
MVRRGPRFESPLALGVPSIGRGGQKFAEPVALSSAQPADRPLPRRALRQSLNLVTLRARRTLEPKRSDAAVKSLSVKFASIAGHRSDDAEKLRD